MLRAPVRCGQNYQLQWIRLKSSSIFIRDTFVEYFVKDHGHKYVKSSSVVPLYDTTVPFVNAGMNQFKGVFLGKMEPPCPRAVNSQKCVRVGGKHNDLDVVGTDGHHHTFFEMLGNWSFGDYYKKEACEMAWDLLLGPYRLKPDNLVVTYFSGDAVMNIPEDRECRDIWKAIGVPGSRLKGLGAAENFWEMGATGPCGPCTEIHYVNPDGSLTEIWNLVFIQCNRESDGKVKPLSRHHVDTGMGLERMAALLQRVPTNYDTDLFQPIIKVIEKNSKGVTPYGGSYKSDAVLDCAYRRLADHARMTSVCLADGAFPATSLNLKQIMRKSFKISNDVFNNTQLLKILYDEVAQTLGSTYPELITKRSEAKLIIDHEEHAYGKMRAGLVKKWKDLVMRYPEVEAMSDVEMAGFALGYKEFKEAMSKQNSTVIPGELVFKLYDTHGFQEDIIQRIADLNNLTMDKQAFWKLLSNHKTRHKTAFKEQGNNKGHLFNEAIGNLIRNGVANTNDSFKYNYTYKNNKIDFEPLKSKLVAILNEECVWIDFLDPCENRPYYLVTKDTNFYCEEGGQAADEGFIRVNKNVRMIVDSVFKIRDFVFHKGFFEISSVDNNTVRCNSDVVLEINGVRRLNLMRNHTAVHLLNAAVRIVLPNSVVCPIGSSVTDKGLYLNLSVYGEKLSQKAVLDVQELIRQAIAADVAVHTRVVDSVALSGEHSVATLPGETYPDTGLRLVTAQPPLLSKTITPVVVAGELKRLSVVSVQREFLYGDDAEPLQSNVGKKIRELCCGTHVPSTAAIGDFCITLVKGAGGQTPAVHALTGDRAAQARVLFSQAEKLEQVIELVEPQRRKEEVSRLKNSLAQLCGTSGAPYGDYSKCLMLLDTLQKREVNTNDVTLHAIAETEVREAVQQAMREGRRFVVHFLRCSYLMQGEAAGRVLAACDSTAPALLMGCAGGVVIASCTVPQEMASESFSAERWLGCILPIFEAEVLPARPGHSLMTHAEMTATKVSLINCEQLVQDAMRVAIKFAQSHTKDITTEHNHPTETRQQN